MATKEYSYGEAQRPHHQFPLRQPKGQSTQDRWIVAAWGKDTFSLVECSWSVDDELVVAEDSVFGDYSELWKLLAGLELDGNKWWLIGHGTSYALDRADFIGALERGDVCLPKIAKGKNKGKHGGKLTLSRRITEVDLLCRKNKIKLLDWQNYAVSLSPVDQGLGSITLTDCCNTLRSWLKKMQQLQVEVTKTSAAQLGWSKARTTKPTAALHVNLDPQTRALERRAYHAGRNECFRLGRVPGTTYSLDVKSCYATICRGETLPTMLIEEYRHGLGRDCVDVGGSDHWIADVVVNTDTADYPLQWQGTPIFPTGQFRTALPWPELRHALRANRVVKLLRAARYESAPALKEYAEWYLRARVELAKSESPCVNSSLKAMFNASLGYTARQKYEWYPWETQLGFPYWLGIAASPEDRETPVQAQKLDTERRWLRVDGEPREAMPFLHATICSYARVRLLEIFAAAGRENVLYCDTDGLLVNSQGLVRLRDSLPDVGKLPFGLVERFAPGRAYIQGQKSYRVGSNIVHAGVADTRRSALAVGGDAIACGVDDEIDHQGKRRQTTRVLTCKTGRASLDGAVAPLRFTCEDTGDQNERWTNEEA